MLPGPGFPIKKSESAIKKGICVVKPSTWMGIRVQLKEARAEWRRTWLRAA
jgi:hypothetical protein